MKSNWTLAHTKCVWKKAWSKVCSGLERSCIYKSGCVSGTNAAHTDESWEMTGWWDICNDCATLKSEFLGPSSGAQEDNYQVCTNCSKLNKFIPSNLETWEITYRLKWCVFIALSITAHDLANQISLYQENVTRHVKVRRCLKTFCVAMVIHKHRPLPKTKIRPRALWVIISPLTSMRYYKVLNVLANVNILDWHGTARCYEPLLMSMWPEAMRSPNYRLITTLPTCVYTHVYVTRSNV